MTAHDETGTYLAGFLDGAQAGYNAAARSLGRPERLLAGPTLALGGSGAVEPTQTPEDDCPHFWATDWWDPYGFFCQG